METVRAATKSTLISLSRVKEEDPIVLKMQDLKEAEGLSYWMGRMTPLRFLMLDYCDRTGAVFESARFTYDGKRVHPDKTADDLEMVDGDIIDVFSDQDGGSFGTTVE